MEKNWLFGFDCSMNQILNKYQTNRNNLACIDARCEMTDEIRQN